MATKAETFWPVSEVKVVRFETLPEEPDTIVFSFRLGRERMQFFAMTDALAYSFIRQMTEVLFDGDPSRSGVGSPEGILAP